MNYILVKVPWDKACCVFRHIPQTMAQHFHGIAQVLISAGNKRVPACLLAFSPEALTLSLPLHGSGELVGFVHLRAGTGLKCISWREMLCLCLVSQTKKGHLASPFLLFRLQHYVGFSEKTRICWQTLVILIKRVSVWLVLFVYLPTEMEAAVSAPAKPHPVPSGSAAYSWTALISQHRRAVER